MAYATDCQDGELQHIAAFDGKYTYLGSGVTGISMTNIWTPKALIQGMTEQGTKDKNEKKKTTFKNLNSVIQILPKWRSLRWKSTCTKI